MAGTRAVIFANGDLTDLAAASRLIRPTDFLIAADGGFHHMSALGLTPSVLIGDFDSIEPDQVDALQKAGVRILRHPVEKNETDLELAILFAVDEGAQEIVIAGALGGRLDQTLGNVFLLMDPRFAGREIRLDDGCQAAFLIPGAAVIHGEPGDTLSLLPLNGNVSGVVTEGLAYPLRNETLYFYRTRGISNVLVGREARVRFASGTLLGIHSRLIRAEENQTVEPGSEK